MSPELKAELALLNAIVDSAVARRKQWLDDHMAECAEIKVGEEIYDLSSLCLLGTVTKVL